jgi:pantoate--beta-alanine ligase
LIVSGDITEVRQIRWAEPALSWGLVPTMGYLHEGHLSLVRRAQAENERTAVSIFVNPTQFAPTEDLAAYPRDLEHDLNLLRATGVDLVFTPTDATMYPADFQTVVAVETISRPLEGASRPTHFRGVATVVAKLFNILQPARAYFGQKDAQQTVVLRQMVRDLNFNLELIICPTLREADGVAMSSRNARLTPEQRHAAPVLYRALLAARNAYTQGERNGNHLRELMKNIIQAEPLARLDYASAAHPATLQELETVGNTVLFSTAVFFGSTRLIDNILVQPTGG